MLILPLAATYAQPFVFVESDIPPVMQASAAWTDYNKDGKQDIYLCGNIYSANQLLIKSGLYRNDGTGGFSGVKANLPELYMAAQDWKDIDKDGDDDLLISGEDARAKLLAGIYLNHGKGSFQKLSSTLSPVRNGSVRWGDYDADGDQDILLCGESKNGRLVTAVYRNNGNNSFSETDTPLAPVHHGQAIWADIDNDKDLDILLSGIGNEHRGITKLYRNDGGSGFIETGFPAEGMKHTSVASADFNNDGWTDLILSGETSDNETTCIIYRNDGKGSFTRLATNIPGTISGNIDLADFDRDGDTDLVISGETPEGSVTKIFSNKGNMRFEDIYAGLPGISLGGAYWGDPDGDGLMDIFLAGLDNCYDFTAKLFMNDAGHPIADKEEATPDGSGMWSTTELNVKRKSYYYFVYSSCNCDPFNENEIAFHAFVGNIHYSPEKYQLIIKFNSIIRQNVTAWPRVDKGNRTSVGYKTLEEARYARQKVIREYEGEGFTVHFVEW